MTDSAEDSERYSQVLPSESQLRHNEPIDRESRDLVDYINYEKQINSEISKN